jgi:hypothetical protein
MSTTSRSNTKNNIAMMTLMKLKKMMMKLKKMMMKMKKMKKMMMIDHGVDGHDDNDTENGT